jgi:hypothetical protein
MSSPQGSLSIAIADNRIAEQVPRQPRFTGAVTTDLQRLALFSPVDLPHLLYRVSSKESMGSSTELGFQSALCMYHSGNGYLDFGKQEYQEMLSWFLNHKDNLKKRIPPSPFISFSASLVTTLQRAEWLRKQNYKDIRIAVLDTRRLGREHLVLPMDRLLKAFNTLEWRKYIDKDSVDEFLGWYRLDVHTSTVEHGTLVQRGLYKLIPEVQHCAERVGGDLAHLRARLFGRNAEFVSKHLELALILGDTLYPGSPDTQIAFLCLRGHDRHGDALWMSMRAKFEMAIRERYFEPDGRVNFATARYWNWLENNPSGAMNAESKLYNPFHRQLMQEARMKEEEIAADAAYCVKGWLSFTLNERWSPSDNWLDSLNNYLKALAKARDALADGLRDMTLSSLYHTLHGISSDIDAFAVFNDHIQRYTPRKIFEEYIVEKAGQALAEMEKLAIICRTLT